MPKTLRVHNLAKELGVASKDIIAKCHAEGIELKNHMAAISAGLAESIHEWFSGDEDITSVETASPVDLERVLKPRTEPETQVAAATQVAELPVEPVTLAEEFVAAPHAPMIAASEGSAAAAAAEPITTAGETSAPRE
ncbi:MAG: translation initiation factor IF-2 N-terminal domain-containing protein, partial [Planctomycetes bacterium]|nr:translation initiation factor IF-2 N-terminal domain-containing protein [Planctomycetota bacterium]